MHGTSLDGWKDGKAVPSGWVLRSLHLHELHAAVFRAALRGVVGGHGLRVAEALAQRGGLERRVHLVQVHQALNRPTRDEILAAHGVVQQTAPLGVIALSPATSRPRAVRSYFVK